MIKFSTFRALLEAVNAKNHSNVHLKHLEHPEDNIFVPGTFSHSLKALENVHQQLASGGKKSNLLVSTKIDGAPSLVFGIHPITKKFFVGTKSVFNKSPKINYNDKDIDVNHGHSAGLAKKLKEALKYLPDIMPSNGGVYQGDVLFGPFDKQEDHLGIHFKPNTINYTVDKAHKDFKSVKSAKFGIAVHTSYRGKPEDEGTLKGMFSTFDSKGIKLKPSRNVHQSDLNFDQSTVTSYENRDKIDKGLKKASAMWKGFNKTQKEALDYHGALFKTFINKNIREGTKVTISGYEDWCIERLQKKVDSMKSETGKLKHQEVLDEFKENLKVNRGTLNKALDLHKVVGDTKNMIVDAMNTSNHQYQHTVNGQATAPEGFVATSNGVPIKLVHRHEFSKLNFNNTNF